MSKGKERGVEVGQRSADKGTSQGQPRGQDIDIRRRPGRQLLLSQQFSKEEDAEGFEAGDWVR